MYFAACLLDIASASATISDFNYISRESRGCLYYSVFFKEKEKTNEIVVKKKIREDVKLRIITKFSLDIATKINFPFNSSSPRCFKILTHTQGLFFFCFSLIPPI